MAISIPSTTSKPTMKPTEMTGTQTIDSQKSEAELKRLFTNCNLSENGYIKYSDIRQLDTAVIETLLKIINQTLTNKGLNPIKPSEITDEKSFENAIEKYQKSTGKTLGNGNGIKKYADGLLGKKTFEAMFPGLVPSNSNMACLHKGQLIASKKSNPIKTASGNNNNNNNQPYTATDTETTYQEVNITEYKSRDASKARSIRIESAVIIVMKNNITFEELSDEFINQSHLILTADEKTALIEWFKEFSGKRTLNIHDKLLIPTEGQLQAKKEERAERLETEAVLKSLSTTSDSKQITDIEIKTEIESSLSLFSVDSEFKKLDPALIKRQLVQESAKNPYAESSVGASGLMQIMPKTAKGIAKELLSNNYQLSEEEKNVLKVIENANSNTVKKLLKKYPRLNIKMGTYYMIQQYNNFGGNINLALAAYNWGPARVTQFIERHGGNLQKADQAMEAVAKEIILLSNNKSAIDNLCRSNHLPTETAVYIAKIRGSELRLV